jgi:hypothetical protein
LAKAQAVLANPEKSLVGTIPPDRTGGSERSFRYASLASGLELVRKTLGEHEIATVQTTAIWQGAGIPGPYSRIRRGNGSHRIGRVPSCRDSDAASHGRALTYAPLRAVTFGGIAGENGLDAPDIAASTARDGLRQWPWPRPRCPSGKPAQGETKGWPFGRIARSVLASQIAGIGSAADATLWAHCLMCAKNALTTDARQVDVAFRPSWRASQARWKAFLQQAWVSRRSRLADPRAG